VSPGIPEFPAGNLERVTTTEQIRALAMALPEVTEKQHFRFKVPLWHVSGKTFLGMGRDESTAVFCITEQSADAAAESAPAHFGAVRRMDARRSFLGLEVQLALVDADRIERLVTEAWATQAPKRLVIIEHLG
jgi:hypothetical protein